MYSRHTGQGRFRDGVRPCKLCLTTAQSEAGAEEPLVYTRTLGRSGLEVSALGMGTSPIGGPIWDDQGQPLGRGRAEDAEAVRAIHRALDLGITFWDTADLYGTGHSEKLLGLALAGQRERVVLATKFGRTFQEGSRRVGGEDVCPDAIRRACEDSLRRLNTDHIDLYQLHLADCPPERARAVRETLEGLVQAGKIRYYGWSTDDPARAYLFAEGPHCTAIQFDLNLFQRNDAMLRLCREQDLAAVVRGPLGRGLLAGRFNTDSTLPDDDLRSRHWDLKHGEQARQIAQVEQLYDVLTRDGRTLAQAALGWVWAVSAMTIPIPGFRTVAQVEDDAGALDVGPLAPSQVAEIDALLAE